ncbi:MAG: hypothetical protein IJU35_07500 [Paludibacteraceae bacterium]|nr:hypothetical protein [Paludibacteraceae bacterium]
MMQSLYGRKEPNTVQLVQHCISSNPVDFIETVFGHYNFERDTQGNYHIKDDYDFNPEKGGYDVILAPLFGSVKDGKKNMHWDINLGNLSTDMEE